MKYELENGYIQYEIDDELKEVIIENVKVYIVRRGTGTQLINHVKSIAREKGYKITLYAYPQDDTITDDELRKFYEKNGFELSADDVDYRLYEY